MIYMCVLQFYVYIVCLLKGLTKSLHLASVDCFAAKSNIQANYNQLANLPIDLMLDKLYAKGVVTLEEKEKIDSKPLQRDKMIYLLDDIITPSLSVGISIKFQVLLQVMKESGDSVLIDMAKILGMYIVNCCNGD